MFNRFGPPDRPRQRTAGAATRNTWLSAGILLLLLSAHPDVFAQTIELALNGPPTRISGTDLRVGAVYRYSNVLINPPPGVGERDMLVEIVELRGAYATRIDNEAGGA